MSDRRRAALAGLGPALLVVDVQRSFGDPAFLAGHGLSPAASAAVEAAVTTTKTLVDAARARDVPVVWIGLGTDPATPWRASLWLRTGDPDAPYGPDEPCLIGTPGAEWYRVAPAPGETVVTKRGYSGFLGTGLESRLRDAGIGWVAVAGLTTECCVAATATDAFQLGWPVLLPTDAVAAYDPGMHEAALAQLALNVAVPTTAEDLTALWG
ncbi:cysteine hydrolase family protein [Cryptosporangium phraense]|uniref:Cysteine hydrolase n=1 Tax=Cryptosporangium phraense TaxID=2593070 RepID=A0A545ARF4_9ACTN|nr:isochorismatase family cysteine hydrolase [Cryptosporangium phraense]TQS43916.1 cysteine hydrolase [Cryptosporangium phraense]